MNGPARCLRVYIGESDRCHGRNLYTAIVHEARRRGLAGATVARGIMGFGSHSIVHESHLLSLSQDRPIVVEIVDTSDHIEAFLPILTDMMGDGLVITFDVEAVPQSPRESGG